jgi:hypothetical protein
MPDFTTEQLEKIRFCLENWEKIQLFKEKGLFDKNTCLSYIQDNFSPDGKSCVKHFHFTSQRVIHNLTDFSVLL